ncbi:putative phosphate-transport integral membrane ABC transporter PstC2 [Mycobacterium xenopi 3993]|nr:putative phosphate-transport integral membrane ABC transporter PstC2 [Mycobacterium xenopi 3993]
MRAARRGDRLFKSLAVAAGLTIVAAIALIATFLLLRAVPSLRANHANFFTSAKFDTTDPDNLAFGIRDLFMVTVLSSVFALALAMPVAIGIAVFLAQYVPVRFSRPLGQWLICWPRCRRSSSGCGGSSCWRRNSSLSRHSLIANLGGCSCSKRATCRWPVAGASSRPASSLR